MNRRKTLPLEFADAICYSGYRKGQSPRDGTYPDREEIAEDLRILTRHWKYLRVYDCSHHAELVLEVIARDGLDLRVMLGANLMAERSNPACPWGAEFDDATLAGHRRANSEEIDRMIGLARRYREIVFAVSLGNEATVEWSDHLVPVERMIEFARSVRGGVSQPVTFCENYVPWLDKLEPLVAELDFLSLHTYPVWEYQTIENALEYSRSNYASVANRYPDKPVIITEAGWTTASNGRGIEPWNASQELQSLYCAQLMEWTRREGILTFVFEAFDEPWKGSSHPREPEKHWGLFTVDRQPKRVMRDVFEQD